MKSVECNGLQSYNVFSSHTITSKQTALATWITSGNTPVHGIHNLTSSDSIFYVKISDVELDILFWIVMDTSGKFIAAF